MAAAITACAGIVFAGAAQQAQEPEAILSVTVFRDPGFALPGAEIQIVPVSGENAGAKIKKLKGMAGARGEFVVHLPAKSMKYMVSASFKGLRTQEKTVTVQGGGRVDVTFMLERESK